MKKVTEEKKLEYLSKKVVKEEVQKVEKVTVAVSVLASENSVKMSNTDSDSIILSTSIKEEADKVEKNFLIFQFYLHEFNFFYFFLID